MSRLNKSLIGDIQSTPTISSKIDAIPEKYGDINYLGYDSSTKDDSFYLSGNDVYENQVLFWLSSKKGDYVRQPNKGGILYSLLGQLNSDTNLSEWEQDITSAFNEEFGGFLSLMYIKLYTDKSFRRLVITMIVMDNITKKTATITTGASANDQI